MDTTNGREPAPADTGPTEAASHRSAPPDDGSPAAHDPDRRRTIWFEIAAVVCVGVVMDLFTAAWALGWTGWAGEPDDGADDAYTTTWLITRSVAVVVPVLYIIRVSGERPEHFGLVRPRPWSDLGVGLVLFVISIVGWTAAVGALDWALADPGVGSADDWTSPDVVSGPVGPLAWGLVLIGLVANSVAEELVMRGYLIPRLRDATGSAPLAIVVSALLFGAYHMHYGLADASVIVLGGLIFGLYFVAFGRLWPLVVAHTVWNLSTYAWA